MKRLIAAIAAFALYASALRAGASTDLLDRMAAINPGLRSFTATMNANVALKTFPFLSVQLVGTYYHREPDQNKIVFTSGVPAIAEQFDKLYAHVEPPSHWRDVYQVTVVSDDGTTTTYRLVPLKKGNVEHVDARADDKSATVSWMRWNYDNGGYAEMNSRYGHVGDTVVVTSQTGHVQEPGYTADITSTIGGYKINAEIPETVFSQ
jgi:outer membrane lipoprotein-sorting protein